MLATQRFLSPRAAGRLHGIGGLSKRAAGKRASGRRLLLERLEERTVLSGWLANTWGAGVHPGRDIAVDAAGNVYVTGEFEGTTNFIPTAGGQGLSLTSEAAGTPTGSWRS